MTQEESVGTRWDAGETAKNKKSRKFSNEERCSTWLTILILPLTSSYGSDWVLILDLLECSFWKRDQTHSVKKPNGKKEFLQFLLELLLLKLKYKKKTFKYQQILINESYW